MENADIVLHMITALLSFHKTTQQYLQSYHQARIFTISKCTQILMNINYSMQGIHDRKKKKNKTRIKHNMLRQYNRHESSEELIMTSTELES